MSCSRQHKHCSRGIHDTHSVTEDQIRTPFEIADDAIDSTLFALATILPMSSFPVDNVHPSQRYGATGNRSYRVRCRAQYGSARRHNMMPFPPSSQNQFFGRHGMIDEGLCHSMPSLSASTISSGLGSNWSSSNPATDFGSTGTFDAIQVSSNQSAPCASDFLPDSLRIMTQGRPEYAWNEFSSSIFGTDSPQQPLQPAKGHMPYDNPFSGPSLDHCAGIPFDILRTFQHASFPGANTSPGLEVLPQQNAFPLTTKYLSPQYSPNNIDREVGDFLDDLGHIIDWDKIEPCFKDPGSSDVHMAVCSQDTWERGSLSGDAEVSLGFNELLDEDNI